MLDNETKSRIDSARDILVGKIPDPKAQVEQITTALIYKFMDDMDKESVELGGKPQFFTDGFGEYAWSKLMNTRLGGYDRMSLYVEAITKMSQNPHIPPLFRTIFKDAFLPYRDPETLNLFLKEINGFIYDHSERLGDAFEYLLSVLGSQGEAGQFRTPRHIIDFMVEVIAPDKNDTILDPACGTAGFLISAFKHIMKKNMKSKPGDLLNTTERKNLMKNTTGYDISPDMVRISLVNMYLHGFPEPKISEYDTLTSEERWDDMFDVILANPPFMSPKGGIRPHKRFSVQAKRSEVLFVDYIAEHLLPTGRAAVIVPEGIIFQSGTAYKQLRKMLVENFLFGVVSLPAGVFNPYSGVKTSILLLDKTLTKRTDKIIFVKVENDGFDLGAQRRAIIKNDLLEALKNIQEYVKCVREGKGFDAEGVGNVLVVEKEKIGENGDWGLSGERYRGSVDQSDRKYELFKLGEICDINPDTIDIRRIDKEDFINYFDISSIENHTGNITCVNKVKWGKAPSRARRGINTDDVLLSTVRPNLKAFGIIKKLPENSVASTGFAVVRSLKEKIIPDYLISVLRSDKSVNQMISMMGKGAYPSINQRDVKSIKIPLPPLEIQKEIVAEIESYQKIIDGARQVVENYKPQIQIDPEWEMVELGEVCELNPKKSQIAKLKSDLEVSFVPMEYFNENEMYFEALETRELGDVFKGYTYFQDDDVLVAKVTPCFENGKAGFAKRLKNKIGFGSSELYVFRASKKIKPQWIFYNVTTEKFRKEGKLRMTGTGGLQRVPKDFVSSYKIPLPPIETQNLIVSQIEKEQQLVNANKELIKTFEQKIKDRIARVWGE